MSKSQVKSNSLGTWLNGWRLALRLAHRDARRNKARSALVVVLVALPVFAAGVIDLGSAAVSVANSPQQKALNELGSKADAVLTSTGCAGMRQAIIPEGNTACGDLVMPTVDQIRATLPAGTRLITPPAPAYVAMENSQTGISTYVDQHDVSDPVLAGLWNVREGRLPATESEIGLSTWAAQKLGRSVGQYVRVTPYGKGADAISMRIVGLVERPADLKRSVVLPLASIVGGPIDHFSQHPPMYVEGLVSITDIPALNAMGIEVTSRKIAEDPTPACLNGAFCPFTITAIPIQTPDPFGQLQRIEDWLIIGLVSLLVVLQVSLVAGPSFAIQLRKRQHDLGLLASNGAPAAALRRLMLASGVILGLIGGGAGLVASWLATYAAFNYVPKELVSEFVSRPVQMPPFPPSLILLGLTGVISAVVAALIPAIAAGRANVLATLSGRVPQRTYRSRVPLTGFVLVLIGSAGLVILNVTHDSRNAYWISGLEAWLLLCILVTEIGYVVLLPALVVLVGRLARHAPAPVRIAARDASRHRLRTSAAASAVAVAAALSVAAGVTFANAAPGYSEAEKGLAPNALSTYLYNVGAVEGQQVTLSNALLAPTIKAANTALPGSNSVGIAALWGTVDENGEPIRIKCESPRQAARTCEAIESRPSLVYGPYMVVSDATQIRALFGDNPRLPKMIQTLQAGRAISLAGGINPDDSAIALQIGEETVRVKADGYYSRLQPAPIVLSPEAFTANPRLAALTSDSIRADQAVLDEMIRVITMPADSRLTDLEQASFKLNLELVKAGVDANSYWNDGNGFNPRQWLWLGTMLLLAVSLFVGLTVTALAKSDSDRDLDTLAAIGAPPALRRSISASAAAIVTTVGAWMGTLAAITILQLMTLSMYENRFSLGMPWGIIAATCIGVPVVTSLVAYLTTRSHFNISRRRG